MVQLTMQIILKLYCFILLLLAFGVKPVLAQAITTANDGTGTVIDNSNNPNQYDIGGGTQAGKNLFHSFEQFGLGQGQVANFLSDSVTENILGRVISGDASVIDGLLQVSGGQSNLYLMNPAGILFGPNTQLNLPADFTATTANGIQLGDGWFNAMGTNDYAQLVNPPSGFAFTNSNPGAVINAGNLVTSADVTLLGGSVVNTGTVETDGGNITIASVPGENLVTITPEGSLLSLALPVETRGQLSGESFTATDIPSLLSGGDISQQDLGIVVVDGVVKIASTNTTIPTSAGTTIVSGTVDVTNETATGTGGAVDILGDRVGLVDATVTASGTNGGGTVRIGGAYQGQGPVPNAEFTYVSQDSNVVADALTSGNGGQVIVWADDSTEFYGSITARGGSSSGDGGFVEVSGRENLTFYGQADTAALNGAYGTLLLDPRNIFIVKGGSGESDSEFNNGQILASNIDSLDFSISASVLEQQQGRTVLQANENIEVDPGISLTFLTGVDGKGDSIIFQADYDQDGSGDFLMDPTQSITALSRDLSISAVYIETGNIESEGLTLQASSNGYIITGDLVTQGITSLVADTGDIVVGSIKTDLSFESFGLGGSDSLISESNPLVSIQTNGLVRIVGGRGIDINVNEERTLDVSGTSLTGDDEEVRSAKELLGISHGGSTTFITSDIFDNSQIVIQGGEASFGFVIVDPFDMSSEDLLPEGISGIDGSIELDATLTVEVQEFNNGITLISSAYDSSSDLFTTANTDIGTPVQRTQQTRSRTTVRNILSDTAADSGENAPIVDGSGNDGGNAPIIASSDSDLSGSPVSDGPDSGSSVSDSSVTGDGNAVNRDGSSNSVNEPDNNANSQDTISTANSDLEDNSLDSGEGGSTGQGDTSNSPKMDMCSSFYSTEILDIHAIAPEECQNFLGTYVVQDRDHSL